MWVGRWQKLVSSRGRRTGMNLFWEEENTGIKHIKMDPKTE